MDPRQSNLAPDEAPGDTTPPGASLPPRSLNARVGAVAKNVASGYVTLFIGAILGLVVTPILLHHLGASGFGTWSLVLATGGYLGLLELGLGTATTTRVAALETQGPQVLARVVSTSLTMFAGVAAVGLLITVLISILFPTLFSVAPHLAMQARLAFLLIGSWQCTLAVIGVYSAFLIGTGRMYLVNLRGFGISVGVSLAQAGAAIAGARLIPLAAIQLAGGLLTLAVFRIEVSRHLPGQKLTPRSFDRATARYLLALGWRNSVSGFAGALAFGSDLVLVGLLLNPTAAAGFAVAQRVSNFMSRLTSGVVGASGPSHAHAAHNTTDERRFDLYCLVLSLTLVLATPMTVVVATFRRPLLHLWLGRFPSDAAAVVLVLAIVLLLQAPGLNASIILTNSERAREVMRVTLVAALVNVVASIVLTLTIGVVGPALGSLTAVVIFDFVYFPIRLCRILEQPYARLLRRVAVPLVIPLVVVVAVAAAGEAVGPHGISALIASAIAGLAFCVAVWFTSLGRDLRRTLLPAIPGFSALSRRGDR